MTWVRSATRCRALLAASTNLLYFCTRSGSHHYNAISHCGAFIFSERNRITHRRIHQFHLGTQSDINFIQKLSSRFQGSSRLASSFGRRAEERSLHHSHHAGHPLADSINDIQVYHHDARSRAEAGFSLLARHGRTWRRLSHLVDMAILSKDTAKSNTNTVTTTQYDNCAASKSTIADIGTDHGLLAVGLALTGRFDKVIGVDVSDLALTKGAFALIKRVQNLDSDQLSPSNSSTVGNGTLDLPVEFRLGNGLTMLGPGEANCVCIAGMGVHRMIEILGGSTGADEGLPDGGNVKDLARIGCRQLILQPNNSRPVNLILLYDALQRDGWRLADERIAKLSSRWYVTSCFRKQTMGSSYIGDTEVDDNNPSPMDLPGSKIILQDTEGGTMRTVLDEYVEFHKQWIELDASNSNQNPHPDDQRWLDFFVHDNHKIF
jgi:tRNA A22 N-methylase